MHRMAAETRQVEIENDKLGRTFVKSPQCVEAVGDDVNDEAFSGQHRAIEFP